MCPFVRDGSDPEGKQYAAPVRPDVDVDANPDVDPNGTTTRMLGTLCSRML